MIIKSIIVSIAIILVLSFEIFFPKEKIEFKDKFTRILKNIFFWLVNIGITPIIILPITIYATQFEVHSLFKFDNLIISFLFNLVILDIFLYWWHRLNHEVSFLWRFHHVHHLDETLDITSGVRFHFGEVILSAIVRSFIIILFNISLINLLLIEAIILTSSIFHHSNIDLPKKFEKYLSYIIVTPCIHWVHHHKRQSETDANYSTIFSWWDKIFNSKSKFIRKVGMSIGVEGDREQNLLNLILRPIKK
ncbi:sterol desaturase family protein [Candidatus Pelagibacter sp. HIMB1321]|uniref:sterol desaturase family protein n=1 Tax=Candidatus Pelagibacter sp. HIMB1321 TaxID=1388755 RepID=UPI000A07E0E1|nr:sterol desaturase family protein [Candidatus Pelagibacter sp. HIMB1321]SMF77998.1 Sterol desaturase/sphingolipid hydroxylase, fatty acid hydroxylase superfamily [Candidatus Pelagibacter sp. HIMB1321]